jgi:hypothetical protein
MVQGASHHFWTHQVKETDGIEVERIREYIYSVVMDWLDIDSAARYMNTKDSRPQERNFLRGGTGSMLNVTLKSK